MTTTNDTVPDIELAGGVNIPQVGFGVFQIPGKDTQRAVEEALEIGYRHFDTAAAYYNEEGVGAALRATGMAGKVFVTTKLRNCDQGYDAAKVAFEESRRKLGVDVLDLYLIHWPFALIDRYVETWRAILEIKEQGALRAAGVSNFLTEHLQRLIDETGEAPVIDQIEVHPRFSQPDVREYCASHGIAVEAYSPLGHGGDMNAPEVLRAAEAHGVTPAQVVLHWHVQSGRVVIPKSSHPDRMRQNLDIFGFSLTDEEMAAIDALHTPQGRISGDPATNVNSQSWADQFSRGNVS
ncbi:aldo/keto reductase [Bifidobacterium sp. SMB2]|uniref:Aldo/keto reductase n=1 Tax=Bifidobacterium saimiriisciurei TaxID=2661627 RepID=A0ABX0C8P3_9BIFI|nr:MULTISPECIES: aldo/keto reductase [Bifidobacterium]NEG96952.1 aldo/keto reductase [Bifidobacterium sp. SMB2]NEH11518.1 aldo/keto reductase [Bifidobacterium saimiriisciurei]